MNPGFIRKANGTNCNEAYHLIPLSEQDNFEFSLDASANIVSLCSNCHNQLHYGIAQYHFLQKLMRRERIIKGGQYRDYFGRIGGTL